MDLTEQIGLCLWVKALMDEHGGGTETQGANLEDKIIKHFGNTQTTYSTSRVRMILSEVLGPELESRIDRVKEETGSYYGGWPLLNDADIGLIMKAGAARFLIPVED